MKKVQVRHGYKANNSSTLWRHSGQPHHEGSGGSCQKRRSVSLVVTKKTRESVRADPWVAIYHKGVLLKALLNGTWEHACQTHIPLQKESFQVHGLCVKQEAGGGGGGNPHMHTCEGGGSGKKCNLDFLTLAPRERS